MQKAHHLHSSGGSKPILRRVSSHVVRSSFRNSVPKAKSRIVQPAAATGGGDSGAGGNLGGSGGGGGKGENENNKSGALGSGPLAGFLKGWQDRVSYDPDFIFKVFLEQVIGVGACVIGDMSSRPNWGLNELDFVFSTLVVGSLMNFSLMYLLAPTAASGSTAGKGLIAKALSEQTLKNWGAPGGGMFERGSYTIPKRLLNLGYKGCVFAVIGFLAGVLGTAVSNGLLCTRQMLDPNFRTQNTQPNILANAGCWAAHMGISSNVRYQALGGLDLVLSTALPKPVFRTYSTLIRCTNNVVGGISFVTLARVLGVQKAAEAAPEVAPPPPVKPTNAKDKKNK